MNNLSYLSAQSTVEEAEIIIQGIPYDGTVSFRPGTRFAPNAIRQDSYGLEKYSPYQNEEIDTRLIADIGDVEVFYGSAEKTLNALYESSKYYVNQNKKIFTIGGEHLMSLSPIKAVAEKYPDLKVVHFDAHTDLRDSFFDEELSHATVMKKVTDILGDRSLYQFGIRSGLKEEFEYSANHQYIEKYSVDTVSTILDELIGHPVYISLDVDVLDPSVMPGTGTQEPGGVTFKELLAALLLLKGLHIVGMDIVELAPQLDASNASTAVASKLVREMLLLF